MARAVGDFDADGDVDLVDCAAFPQCASGPGAGVGFLTPSALCRLVFDFDLDDDVDLLDFAALQGVMGL
jgi:hypothetical protein